MKNIAICCDGTWNQPDQRVERDLSPTNVVKLASLIYPRTAEGVEQRVFYHYGIGSDVRGVARLVAGASGRGIDQVIKECHRWLVRKYSPGDALFIFGFSRGAYTARSLAGLVRNSGILRPENEDRLDDAFALYRSRSIKTAPRAVASTLFRKAIVGASTRRSSASVYGTPSARSAHPTSSVNGFCNTLSGEITASTTPIFRQA